MRWVTHQVAAAGAAILLHLPPAGLAAALAGAILPDVFDQKLAGLFRNRQTAFNRLHRGFTHWPGLWLALLLVSVTLVPHTLGKMLQPVLFGIALGGLSHVILDMLTPQGIPLSPFSRKNRFSLNLCRTGGLGEYAFLIVMLAGMWFFLRGDILNELVAARRFLLG